MAKKVIKINEATLKKIVAESVKNVLKEDIGTDRRAIKDLTAKAKAIDPNFNYYKALNKGYDVGHRYDENERGWSITTKDSDFSRTLDSLRNGLDAKGDGFGMHPSDFWNALYDNKRISHKVKVEISNARNTLKKYFNYGSPIIQAMENYIGGTKSLVAYHTGDEGKLTSVYSDYYDTPKVNTGRVYNPFTETYEKMNLVDAKKLALKYAEERRSSYGDKDTALNDAGYEIKLDTARTNPVDFLNFFADKYSEPEDWYERNEHGDFDEY